jgi:hypothetical protein
MDVGGKDLDADHVSEMAARTSGHLRHEIGETVGHPLSGRQQFGNRVASRFRWLRLSGGRFSLDGWYGVGVGDEETARSRAPATAARSQSSILGSHVHRASERPDESGHGSQEWLRHVGLAL